MFDPYHTWLGIPPKDQPPDHYRLLGLDLFEASATVISSAADRQMAHVRTVGRHCQQTEAAQLLNDLSAARVCLLDKQKKQQYDCVLREQIWAIPIKRSPSIDSRPPMPGPTQLDKGAVSAILPSALPPRRHQKTRGVRFPAMRRTPRSRDIAVGCAALAVLALVGFGQTYGCLPGVTVASNYLCLAVVCAACVKGIQTLWFSMRVFYAGTSVVVLVALLIHGWTDTYTIEWTELRDPETLEWTRTVELIATHKRKAGDEAVKRFRDTHARWGSSNCPVRRYLELFSEEDAVFPSFVASGLLKGDQELHDRWELTLGRWPNPQEHTTAWYWYGEEITEGEWHLRNR